MTDRARVTGTSGDLFAEMSAAPVHDPIVLRRTPAELRAARALCLQLRRKQSLPEKQRIAHLICLNLIALLRHGARP